MAPQKETAKQRLWDTQCLYGADKLNCAAKSAMDNRHVGNLSVTASKYASIGT